jgi:hypothetical protein
MLHKQNELLRSSEAAYQREAQLVSRCDPSAHRGMGCAGQRQSACGSVGGNKEGRGGVQHTVCSVGGSVLCWQHPCLAHNVAALQLHALRAKNCPAHGAHFCLCAKNCPVRLMLLSCSCVSCVQRTVLRAAQLLACSCMSCVQRPTCTWHDIFSL